MEKRSITLDGHRTSIALETAFWDGLDEIAAANDVSVPVLIAAIDRGRGTSNLASALRVAVLDHYRGATVAG